MITTSCSVSSTGSRAQSARAQRCASWVRSSRGSPRTSRQPTRRSREPTADRLSRVGGGGRGLTPHQRGAACNVGARSRELLRAGAEGVESPAAGLYGDRRAVKRGDGERAADDYAKMMRRVAAKSSCCSATGACSSEWLRLRVRCGQSTASITSEALRRRSPSGRS